MASQHDFYGKALVVDGNTSDQSIPNNSGQALIYNKTIPGKGTFGTGATWWTWGILGLNLGNANSIYTGEHVVPMSTQVTFLIRY